MEEVLPDDWPLELAVGNDRVPNCDQPDEQEANGDIQPRMAQRDDFQLFRTKKGRLPRVSNFLI
ncbi:hypothetical protein D9M68_647880 [compost metagenome]